MRKKHKKNKTKNKGLSNYNQKKKKIIMKAKIMKYHQKSNKITLPKNLDATSFLNDCQMNDMNPVIKAYTKVENTATQSGTVQLTLLSRTNSKTSLGTTEWVQC